MVVIDNDDAALQHSSQISPTKMAARIRKRRNTAITASDKIGQIFDDALKSTQDYFDTIQSNTVNVLILCVGKFMSSLGFTRIYNGYTGACHIFYCQFVDLQV